MSSIPNQVSLIVCYSADISHTFLDPSLPVVFSLLLPTLSTIIWLVCCRLLATQKSFWYTSLHTSEMISLYCFHVLWWFLYTSILPSPQSSETNWIVPQKCALLDFMAKDYKEWLCSSNYFIIACGQLVIKSYIFCSILFSHPCHAHTGLVCLSVFVVACDQDV